VLKGLEEGDKVSNINIYCAKKKETSDLFEVIIKARDGLTFV